MTRADAAQVSVVVPCHNDGAYLAEALDSVFAQTRCADEIIVVDDGSTDTTRAVAEGFAQLRYVARPHRGIAATRNAALAEATGDIIAFLDADDVWPRESLALRLRRMDDAARPDAVCGLTEEFRSPDFAGALPAARLARGAVAVRLAGAMLVRRDAFARVGGFDEAVAVGEWIDWVDRFTRAGLRLDFAPALVLRRRLHAGNTAGGAPAVSRDYLSVLRTALHRR